MTKFRNCLLTTSPNFEQRIKKQDEVQRKKTETKVSHAKATDSQELTPVSQIEKPNTPANARRKKRTFSGWVTVEK